MSADSGLPHTARGHLHAAGCLIPTSGRGLALPARATATLLLLALLTACAGRPPAPIEDHSRPGSSPTARSYTVTRGDTLFSIAFRYGLDYKRLAAANAIGPPYTIFVGQSLRLAEANPATVSTKPAPAAPQRQASTSSTSPKTTAKPPTSPTKTPAKPTATASGTNATARANDNRTVSRWRWPSSGKLTRRFDGERHKGLDLGGKRGDPIEATAGGRVVYAGTGIVGYGLVLIVRHNDEFLSAYGHNDELLVEEGDTVTAGQTIARMGSSGTDTVKLHFELRRQGRPVDPLKLLPAR